MDEIDIKNEISDTGEIDSDDSRWGLEILIKSSPRKQTHKEIDEKDKEVIEEVEDQIERTLEEKAAKSNLSHSTVKSILKHVLSDEHVLALVKQKEGCEQVEGIVPYEPKITRSKAKELLSQTGNQLPVPLNPPDEASEVQVLLTEDLHEDSSGDEYVPGDAQEDESEDEEGDSPKKEVTSKKRKVTNDVAGSSAKRKKTKEDAATIALRTRSKLSLSETPLEQIEQEFVPPDIETDMYEMKITDDDWKNFLDSFNKPLDEVAKCTEDEDLDSEYNILSDEDINTFDKEEMREDKAVKVPKKELNNLMAELFEYIDICSWKVPDQEETNTAEKDALQEEELLAQIEIVQSDLEMQPDDISRAFTHSQLLLLEQQMRQHVQMLLQNFLLTYKHPLYADIAYQLKEYLLNFTFLLEGKEHSYFRCSNLVGSLEMIANWEKKFEDKDPEALETIEHFQRTLDESVDDYEKKKEYFMPFPPLILKTIANSDLFFYPYLLPKIPFKHPVVTLVEFSQFGLSEFQLIAMALEQFIPYFSNFSDYIAKNRTINLRKIASTINKFVLPGRNGMQIYRQILEKKKPIHIPNPIAHYFWHGVAPLTFHQVNPLEHLKVIPPKDRPPELLPRQWRHYIYPDSQVQQVDRVVLDANVRAPTNALILNRLPSRKTLPKFGSRLVARRGWTDVNNDVSKYRADVDRRLKITYGDKQRVKYHAAVVNRARLCFRNTIKFVDFYLLKNSDETCETMSSMPNLNDENSVNPSDAALRDTTKTKSVEGDSDPKVNIEPGCSSNETKAKKDTTMLAERKMAKKRREYLASIAMLAPPDPATEKDRREQFAQAYFKKLSTKLSDTEYDKIRQIFSRQRKAETAVDIFKKMEEALLPDHKDLMDEFVLFLDAEQALAVGKLIPFFILNTMSAFLRNLEVYFKNQPAQLKKIYKCLFDLNDTPSVTLDRIKATVLPLLKGNPLLCDSFLRIFIEETPTATLLNGAWEIIDVNKDGNRPQSEAALETVTVPNVDESPCACSCHKVDVQQPLKEHCINCGLRFVQGRIYCQTARGLKPVRVKFTSDADVDHNARLGIQSKAKKVETTKTKRTASTPTKESLLDDKLSKEVNSKKPRKTKAPRQPPAKKNSTKKKATPKRKAKSTKATRSNSLGSPCKRKAGSTAGQIKRLAEEDFKFVPSPEFLDINTLEEEENTESIKVKVEAPCDNWSREEDKIILETFQQYFNDKALKTIAKKLENRSVDDIKNRFEELMALLEEMENSTT